MPRTKNPVLQPMDPEERAKYDARYRNLCTKDLVTLSHFDFDSLQRMGISDQVTLLLERVGITREFLGIGLQHIAFVEATRSTEMILVHERIVGTGSLVLSSLTHREVAFMI